MHLNHPGGGGVTKLTLAMQIIYLCKSFQSQHLQLHVHGLDFHIQTIKWNDSLEIILLLLKIL